MSFLFLPAWLILSGCAPDASPPGPVVTDRRDGGGTPRDPDAGASARQPLGWDEALRLREAADRNPDPAVVEIDLEAKVAPVDLRPGTKTQAWTYGGTVPGPLIRVKKGDRLIVHFTNSLPEETTIHWHGLRIPVNMDGVPGHSQATVKPGGKFDYDFVVPDAGLFWFHPHHRSAKQLGDGLYGALLVQDPDEPSFGDELPIVLSDVSLDPAGPLSHHGQGGDIATLFGREGNVLLVNGRANPTLIARAGMRQRWRIVNTARSRYFQLALAGHSFTRIGGDGGLIGTPQVTDRLVIIPGERADVTVVLNGAPGSSIPLRWVPYDRGYGSAFNRPEEVMLTVRFADELAVPTPSLPSTGRTIAPLDTAGATPIQIAFTQSAKGQPFSLGVNGQAFGGDQHLHARVGETQVWTVSTDMVWDHPFHLHGFFFQVLDAAGRPVEPIEWKDTANVPQKGKGNLKVAVKYDDRPGMWMFHCHILDHADAGMMGTLTLEK